MLNSVSSLHRRLYWEPFFVKNQHISLSHLEPHEFECQTPDGSTRRVKVVYSPHVFTKGADDSTPDEEVCFDQRVFCPNRYKESISLPSILTSLPNERVFQSWEKRNYVFLAVETPKPNDRYHIFFKVSKEGGKRNKHVQVMVESAHRKSESSYVPPEKPNTIRFAQLIQMVFMGRPVKFAPR